MSCVCVWRYLFRGRAARFCHVRRTEKVVPKTTTPGTDLPHPDRIKALCARLTFTNGTRLKCNVTWQSRSFFLGSVLARTTYQMVKPGEHSACTEHAITFTVSIARRGMNSIRKRTNGRGPFGLASSNREWTIPALMVETRNSLKETSSRFIAHCLSTDEYEAL